MGCTHGNEHCRSSYQQNASGVMITTRSASIVQGLAASQYSPG